ncbi:MAG: helix-turn-helix domain-containing protein [Acidobacteria bacterium]|nr:helix-turn-helix domain-containing protein [Acidobacteriota bacterium]
MPAARIDPYIVDVLMPDLTGHDRRPSAFLVYLFLWHRSQGDRTRGVRASYRTIAEATGLSKSAVQAAVRTLTRRRLVHSLREGRTAVPEYTVHRPWARAKAR